MRDFILGWGGGVHIFGESKRGKFTPQKFSSIRWGEYSCCNLESYAVRSESAAEASEDNTSEDNTSSKVENLGSNLT